MKNNDVESLLLKHSFIKEKNSNNFYYITNVILDETCDFLTIHIKINNGQIIISDNGQLLESYDYPNIDIIKIRDKIFKQSVKNLFCDGLEIYCLTTFSNILQNISDFIKTILIFENLIKKYINKM